MIWSRSIALCCVGLALLIAPGRIRGEGESRVEPTLLNRSVGEVPVSELERLRRLQRRLVELADRVAESAVFIHTGASGGSGFIISEDGLVLTNQHVVSGPGGPRKSVLVHFRRGRHLMADLVGYAPGGDLALLQLHEPPGRPALPLGDSDALRPGQPIIVVGDPFLVGSRELFLKDSPPDYEPAVSLGIVSALHRYSEAYPDSIQVDASINPGNSGGPLLNLDGEVVGINGKIENPFGVGINAGIGYAVPSNQVKRFLKPLKEAGGGPVHNGTIHGLRVARRASTAEGLPILQVASRSPAESYGFEAGDRVLTIGGSQVSTRNRYRGILGTYPAGSRVVVRVRRGGGEVDVEAALFPSAESYLGLEALTVVKPTEGVQGVRVITVTDRGPAARGGLRADDVIQRFGAERVSSTVDLSQLLKRYHPGDKVALDFVRAGETLQLELELGSKSR